MFKKEYIIKNRNILTVLDKYQEFQTTFDRFVKDRHNYECKITIEKISEWWVCKININESKNIKTIKRTAEVNRVL